MTDQTQPQTTETAAAPAADAAAAADVAAAGAAAAEVAAAGAAAADDAAEGAAAVSPHAASPIAMAAVRTAASIFLLFFIISPPLMRCRFSTLTLCVAKVSMGTFYPLP